eukprot:jgi/Botrbrau1/16/Bobra.0022s0013.1
MGVWNACFGCCFRKRYQGADLGLLNFQARGGASLDELIERSRVRREQLWQQIGILEPMILSSSYSQCPGPRWPAGRQAFRLIRTTPGNVVLTSDGLSDPFDDLSLDGNVNGFGLEFYLETPEDELKGGMHAVKQSWQFQLLYTVSQLAAGHGGIRAIMDDMRLLSTEAEGVQDAIPEQCRQFFVNSAGRVGALLGLIPNDDESVQVGPSFPTSLEGMPISDVLFVNIKLLTLQELQIITDRGAEGRQKLDSLFTGSTRLLSSLTRPSVV